MAQLLPDYAPPIVICSTSSTGVQPDILDIGNTFVTGYPPVLTIYISATATVKVWGARTLTATNPPTLVRKIDYSGGGFTVSDSYDLIPGIRFWQIEVTANTGDVIVETSDDGTGYPQFVRMSNNAPQGT